MEKAKKEAPDMLKKVRVRVRVGVGVRVRV
jgi:hypothetical protein